MQVLRPNRSNFVKIGIFSGEKECDLGDAISYHTKKAPAEMMSRECLSDFLYICALFADVIYASSSCWSSSAAVA